MTTEPKEEQVMGSYSAGSSCPQMGNDRPQPSGGIEDTDQAELCALIFDNVEASVDYIGKDKATPIAVLSDVMAAADAIRAAGYRRLSAAPPTLEVGWRVVPETPTRAMLVAGDTNGLGCRMGNLDFVHDIYSNMIAAAPLPSPPDAGSGGIAATAAEAQQEHEKGCPLSHIPMEFSSCTCRLPTLTGRGK